MKLKIKERSIKDKLDKRRRFSNSGNLLVNFFTTSYPSTQKFCADAGYRGTFVSDVKERLGLGVDISEKIKPHQWEKLPWHWVVGRTFSWINNFRRLSIFRLFVGIYDYYFSLTHFVKTFVNTGS